MHWVYVIWFAVIVAVLGSVTISIVVQMVDWNLERFTMWFRAPPHGWGSGVIHGWQIGRTKGSDLASRLSSGGWLDPRVWANKIRERSRIKGDRSFYRSLYQSVRANGAVLKESTAFSYFCAESSAPISPERIPPKIKSRPGRQKRREKVA